MHVANACRSIPSLVFFECSVRSSASIFFVLLEGVALQDDLLVARQMSDAADLDGLYMTVMNSIVASVKVIGE